MIVLPYSIYQALEVSHSCSCSYLRLKLMLSIKHPREKTRLYKNLGTSGLKTQRPEKKKIVSLFLYFILRTHNIFFTCFSVNIVVDILCTIPNIRSCQGAQRWKLSIFLLLTLPCRQDTGVKELNQFHILLQQNFLLQDGTERVKSKSNILTTNRQQKKQALVKNMQILKIKLAEQGKHPDTQHFANNLFPKTTGMFQIYHKQLLHFY